MDNIHNISKLVVQLLNENPDTRNSDYELYYQVCRKINPLTLGMSFGVVLRHRNEFGLPSIETVGRCRRKAVEVDPSLSGDSNVEAQRAVNEEKFIEYARKF